MGRYRTHAGKLTSPVTYPLSQLVLLDTVNDFTHIMMLIKNRPSKMKFFCIKEYFFVNFDFKNGCKNEFEDNNEKSCS